MIRRLKKIVIIIPAFNPEQRLLNLVKQLETLDFKRIIIVDDGSCSIALPIFTLLEKSPNVTVLRHAINCGKGRALKTAFNHFLIRYGIL